LEILKGMRQVDVVLEDVCYVADLIASNMAVYYHGREQERVVGVCFEGVESLTRLSEIKHKSLSDLNSTERTLLLSRSVDWYYNPKKQWITGFWGRGMNSQELLNDRLGIYKFGERIVGARLFGVGGLVDIRT